MFPALMRTAALSAVRLVARGRLGRRALAALLLALITTVALPVARAGADVSERATFTTSVAIEVPAFRGAEPSISLEYDSSARNGLVGVGWRLQAGSSITRSGPEGGTPSFDDAKDTFMLDGEELVRCAPTCGLAPGATHSTRVRDFAKLRYDDKQGTWTRWRPDGVRLEYTALSLGATAKGTYQWALTSVVDTHNQVVSYEYGCGALECYPTRIKYADPVVACDADDTSCAKTGAEILFHYVDARQDPVSYATGASLALTEKLLRTIEVKMAGKLVRAYALAYEPSKATGASLLRSVQEFAADANVTALGEVSVPTGGTPPQPPITLSAPAMSGAEPAWKPRKIEMGDQLSTGPSATGNAKHPDVFAGKSVAIPAGTIHDPLLEEERYLPYGSAMADFNRDGRTDFAAWGFIDGCDEIKFTTLLAGRPDAVEGDPQPVVDDDGNGIAYKYAWLCEAATAQTGDFNGDRRADILLRTPTNTVSVAWSRGGGGFTPRLLRPAPVPSLQNCVTGDLDDRAGDELACVYDRNGAPQLGVVRFKAKGYDLTETSLAAQGIAKAARVELAIGDVNSDSSAEVLIAARTTAIVNKVSTVQWRLLIGTTDGAGGVSAWRVRIPGWSDPGYDADKSAGAWSLKSADVDGDGNADLIVYLQETGLVRISTSVKNGASNASTSLTIPAGDLVVGDYSGDAIDDLTVSGAGLHRLRATGDGHFDPPELVAGPGTPCFEGYQPVDVDGNLRVDWLCATNTNEDATQGDMDFRFQEYISPDGTPDRYRWLAADVTGEGREDLLYPHPLHPGVEVSVLRAQPSGGYEPLPPQPILNANALDGMNARPTAWIPMDVGGPQGRADGLTDLVLPGRDAIYTLVAKAGGWQAKRHPLPWWSSDVQQWSATELNQDGRRDLIQFVALDTGVRVEYLLSAGDGTWTTGQHVHFAETTSKDGVEAPPLVTSPAPRFLATDVNGDRKMDYTLVEPGATTWLRTLVATGDGTWQERSLPLAHPTSPADARGAQPMDYNGDEVGDLAIVRPAGRCLQITAFVSTGSDWMIQDAPMPPAPACNAHYGVEDTNNIRVVDLNRDGRTDVLHLSHVRTDAGESATAAHLLINRPRGPWSVIDKTIALPFKDAWAYLPMDVDGDGKLELVRAGEDLHALAWQAPPQPAVEDGMSERLESVENGHGATTKIRYRTLVGSRDYLPAGSLPAVVDEVTVTDAAHTPTVVDKTTWVYGGATWSDRRHSLLGFKHIEATNGNTIETTAYELSEACGSRVRETTTGTGDGTLLARTETLPTDAGAAAPFTCLPWKITAHACEGKPTCLTKTTELAHDAHGNITDRLELGKHAGSRWTVTDYRPNLGDYIVDRPARIQTFGTETPTIEPKPEDWRLAARTELVYDDNQTWDKQVGAHGDLRQERAWDDHENRFATTVREYDARGNTTATTDPVGVRRTVKYDDTFELFPERSCDPVACTTQMWDAVLGVVRTLTDANGRTTTYGHDAFGRLTSTVRPGGGTTSVRYLDEGSWTGTPNQRRRVRTETADGSEGDGVLWREQLLDGLGRVYVTVAEGVGADIVSEVQYADASDRPAATSSPHAAGAAVTWTQHEYDAAHRPTTTTLADGSTVQTSYPAPGRTLTRDPVGREQLRHTDEFGRVVRVDELATLPEDSATTQYEYNALDHPKRILDDEGHETSTTWDSLGRRVAEQAPDRGPRTWSYRPDGTPESATDARNQTITWEYDDPAGRVTARRERDASGKELRTARWHWDTDPGTKKPHGDSLGRIARSDHSSPVTAGSTDLWYDAEGRAERSRTCVDGTCADMRSMFDAAGRLDILEYPAPVAERVKYSYDDAGELELVRKESGPLYARLGHNARGQLDVLEHGNGLVERYTYDPDRHWLDHHTINLETKPGQPALFDAGYEHYADGKLRLATERNPDPVVQRYFYDDLGRLDIVSSPDPSRRRDYDYDTIGRMRSSSTAGTYAYAQPDQVHAPTSTDTGHTRAYDANGNLTRLHDPTTRDPGAANPTAEWDLELDWTVGGLPEQIAVNPGTAGEDHVKLGYDAEDRRVYKADDGGITRYFNQYLEQRPDGGFTKLYWAGDRLIARRDKQGLTSVHQDRKGSTRALSASGGAAVERFEYDPYGKPLTTLHGDERLWAGKQRDHDTGLVDMNARSYDYELGHFISADSIVPDLYRPQSLNRYSYTEGDPVNYSDPSGHMRQQVELRKEQQAQSTFAHMHFRMLQTQCATWGYCPTEAGPAGTIYKHKNAPTESESSGSIGDASEWAQWPGTPSSPPLVSAPETEGSDPSEWAAWPGEPSAPPLVAVRTPRRQGSDPSEWAQWPGTPSAPPLWVEPFALTFDMDKGVLWVDPGGGGLPYAVNAESGQPGFINQRSAVNMKKIGPLPPGEYEVDMAGLSDPGVLHDFVRNLIMDYGDWRIPLVAKPGTDTMGRDGFYLHGGRKPGSAGCIDIGGGRFGNELTDRVLRDLRAHPGPRLELLVF